MNDGNPPRTFIDSNVLVHAYDNSSPEKRDRSQRWLEQLLDSRRGVLSTQVLQEFVAVSCRKLKLPPIEAKRALRNWSPMETVQTTPAIIDAAIDEMVLSRLSFWDSLIIAAAASAHCTELLSEDFQPGQTLRGVTVRNPFA